MKQESSLLVSYEPSRMIVDSFLGAIIASIGDTKFNSLSRNLGTRPAAK